MDGLSKIRSVFHRKAAEDADSPAVTTTVEENKHGVGSPDDANVENDPKFEELVSEDAQRGVQNVEAVTLTWSKNSLIAVFIL